MLISISVLIVTVIWTMCMHHYFLWLYYVRTVKTVHNSYTIKKNFLTDIDIGSYHIALSDLQYIY